MRAAAIFGPGSSARDLRPFRNITWLQHLPANSSEADAVLIFGGDGTIHRNLEHLVRLQLPVLAVPRGSGNDFARALGLRSIRDSLAAWREFSRTGDNVRVIDLGVITPKADAGEAPAPHQHYFCCVGGVGLDAEIAACANRLPRWLRGHGGYAVSFPSALFRFAAFPMKVTVDDAADSSAKPTILAAFANTPTYGGGMKIAPHARFDDGKLDFCVIGEMDKFKLFCLFPTVYFGRHLSVPEVEYFQAERIRLETETPLDVYADGEYICRTPIEVTVARAALRVIVPAQR